MKTVKGTRQKYIKIVEYRPEVRALLYLLCAGLIAAAVWASHYYTGYGLQSSLEQQQARATQLQQALDKSQAQTVSLEQQLANISLGAEVDRKSSESVRQEITKLKEEVARLKEDNGFYRSLMAPSENARGLMIGAVEIVRQSEPRTYSYRVVVQQLAAKHVLLKGSLTFELVGKLAGQEQRYSLAQLSSQVSVSNVKLRFKYFQTIAGDLVLPEGFEPEAIELLAVSTGKQPQKSEKKLQWLVEEAK